MGELTLKVTPILKTEFQKWTGVILEYKMGENHKNYQLRIFLPNGDLHCDTRVHSIKHCKTVFAKFMEQKGLKWHSV